MTKTPGRPNAPLDLARVGEPQLRRELAQAAAAVELSDLDVSEALAGELLMILKARGEDRGRAFWLVELARMVDDGADFPAPGPAALQSLRRVSERCRVRRELELRREACAQPDGGTVCACQSESIDALLGDGVRPTRRRVAQAAGKRHRSAGRPHVPEPKPEPAAAPVASEEPAARVEDPLPRPDRNLSPSKGPSLSRLCASSTGHRAGSTPASGPDSKK
jgi:hypothetical protein